MLTSGELVLSIEARQEVALIVFADGNFDAVDKNSVFADMGDGFQVNNISAMYAAEMFIAKHFFKCGQQVVSIIIFRFYTNFAEIIIRFEVEDIFMPNGFQRFVYRHQKKI